MFRRRKSKEPTKEEILKEMNNRLKKKKQLEQEIVKLEEDIRKMGKLVLKDGKLQRPEDATKEQQPAQQPTQSESFPEEILRGQQMQDQPIQPPFPPQGQAPQQNYAHNEMPQMQYQQQPQMPQQPQQQYNQQYMQEKQLPQVGIQMFLENGEVLQINIPGPNAKDFLQEASEAINSQQTLQVGTQIINGRYIVKIIIN